MSEANRRWRRNKAQAERLAARTGITVQEARERVREAHEAAAAERNRRHSEESRELRPLRDELQAERERVYPEPRSVNAIPAGMPDSNRRRH